MNFNIEKVKVTPKIHRKIKDQYLNGFIVDPLVIETEINDDAVELIKNDLRDTINMSRVDRTTPC